MQSFLFFSLLLVSSLYATGQNFTPQAKICHMDRMLNGTKDIHVKESMRHISLFGDYRVVVGEKKLIYTPTDDGAQEALLVDIKSDTRYYDGILNPHKLFFKTTLNQNTFVLHIGSNSSMYFTCIPTTITKEELKKLISK